MCSTLCFVLSLHGDTQLCNYTVPKRVGALSSQPDATYRNRVPPELKLSATPTNTHNTHRQRRTQRGNCVRAHTSSCTCSDPSFLIMRNMSLHFCFVILIRTSVSLITLTDSSTHLTEKSKQRLQLTGVYWRLMFLRRENPAAMRACCKTVNEITRKGAQKCLFHPHTVD